MSGYDNFKKGPESSTPHNILHIQPRKGLHADDSISPIARSNYFKKDVDHEQSSEESQESSSEFSESIESEHLSRSKKDDNCRTNSYSTSYSYKRTSKGDSRGSKQHTEGTENMTSYLVGGVIIVISFLSLALYSNSDITPKITIQDIQRNFPLQPEELWIALETGINEVKSLNKPSVFLFLHEGDAESTLNNLLSNASTYAECVLNEDCEIQPITLTSSNLNSNKALSDYGYIISKYKPELEHRTVMIVKDLDKVSGKVAQAFHSMCDEYTPLVEKTVFFFTMKIGNLKNMEGHDVNIVEKILRTNWSDLDEDVFEPLFTRISSIVLRIMPETP